MDFSKALGDFYYASTLFEIVAKNLTNTDLSYNSLLYKKIICQDSKKHSISSIASLLNVATPAVTQKVNELEKKGYVQRVPCTDDKRICYLCKRDNNCPIEKEFVNRDSFLMTELAKTHSKEDIQSFVSMLEELSDLAHSYTNQRRENI